MSCIDNIDMGDWLARFTAGAVMDSLGHLGDGGGGGNRGTLVKFVRTETGAFVARHDLTGFADSCRFAVAIWGSIAARAESCVSSAVGALHCDGRGAVDADLADGCADDSFDA